MDVTGTGTGELESELVGLAGQLAAGQCGFLGLLAEFDTRQGWAGPGLRSCAHWLSWRIGMDRRTAQEQVRVAHALIDLPLITAAFGAGRVSYSKVRAITRVYRVTRTDRQPLFHRPDGQPVPPAGPPTSGDLDDPTPSCCACWPPPIRQSRRSAGNSQALASAKRKAVGKPPVAR